MGNPRRSLVDPPPHAFGLDECELGIRPGTRQTRKATARREGQTLESSQAQQCFVLLKTLTKKQTETAPAGRAAQRKWRVVFSWMTS
jgi:hypothetical protein